MSGLAGSVMFNLSGAPALPFGPLPCEGPELTGAL